MGKNLSSDEILQVDASGSGSNTTGDEEPTATLTYKKDKTSKRYKGTSHSQRKNILNPKKDRKKIIANLFNESDEDVPLDLPHPLSSSENHQDIFDTDDVYPTTTPNSSHRSDLQEKRERMKNKLKRSRGVYENIKSIDNVKKRKSSKDSIGKVKSKAASEPKIYTSDSVKKFPSEEDKNWLVTDDHISDDDAPEANMKIESNMMAGHLTTSSDDETDSTETAEDRRKRLADRKNKKGGDILAWMSRRAKISVNVQTKPNSVILDMALYRMKLLAEEEETVSEAEEGSSALSNRRSASESSDDSIPRGKRISPLKKVKEDEYRDSNLKRHKKKKKKHRSRSVERDNRSPPRNVVWTPAMYQKWDKDKTRTPKKNDSDSDYSKNKKIRRSHSNEPKNSPDKKFSKSSSSKSSDMKFGRSISSVDPTHNLYGPSSSLSKPLSSLPKIPKIKKPE